MEYQGKLYGKVGKHYFPMMQTTEDFDNLEKQRDELIDQLKKWIDGCELQTEHFSELGMTSSELSSQAMGQAYRNVLTLINQTQ